MYVQPLKFAYSEFRLGLNPLDKISMPSVCTFSTAFKFGYNSFTEALYGLRLVSQIVHTVELVALLEHFTITNRGRNPVYTNGPSVEPLPV